MATFKTDSRLLQCRTKNRLTTPLEKWPHCALPSRLASAMAGHGKHIQNIVSQAATAAFVKERERLMAEFRTELRDEAIRTLESLIITSRKSLPGGC